MHLRKPKDGKEGEGEKKLGRVQDMFSPYGIGKRAGDIWVVPRRRMKSFH